jgi:hypothetical protein
MDYVSFSDLKNEKYCKNGEKVKRILPFIAFTRVDILGRGIKSLVAEKDQEMTSA